MVSLTPQATRNRRQKAVCIINTKSPVSHDTTLSSNDHEKAPPIQAAKAIDHRNSVTTPACNVKASTNHEAQPAYHEGLQSMPVSSSRQLKRALTPIAPPGLSKQRQLPDSDVDPESQGHKKRHRRDATTSRTPARTAIHIRPNSRPFRTESSRRTMERDWSGAAYFPGTNLSTSTDETLELAICQRPQRNVKFGSPVESSVAVLTRSSGRASASNSGSVTDLSNVDIGFLFIITTVVTAGIDTDEREPLDARALTGKRIFDSVHSLSARESASVLAQVYTDYPEHSLRSPCMLLGRASFEHLLFCQPGTFRLRFTLMRVSGEISECLLAVDSDPIVVEDVPSPTSSTDGSDHGNGNSDSNSNGTASSANSSA